MAKTVKQQIERQAADLVDLQDLVIDIRADLRQLGGELDDLKDDIERERNDKRDEQRRKERKKQELENFLCGCATGGVAGIFLGMLIYAATRL